MNKCLHCYATGCKERKCPSDITTNYQVINESDCHLARFLSKVITDCNVCPVEKVICKREKKQCEKDIARWLQSKNLKEI